MMVWQLTCFVVVFVASAQSTQSSIPSIETDASGSMVIRVPEGSTVQLAYGSSPPEKIVRQSQLDDLTSLLELTRDSLSTVKATVANHDSQLTTMAQPFETVVADVKTIASTVASHDKCFKQGKLPGADGCDDTGYTECVEQDLVTPTNAVMAGTGLLPGTARKFTCDDGFVLNGASDVHCNLDGSWEATPTCEVDLTPTTQAPLWSGKKSIFWRVRNNGSTTWIPVVSELLMYPAALDGSCGGNRLDDFHAATNYSNFLCSGSLSGVGRECYLAHDGSTQSYVEPGSNTHQGSWRPKCEADNSCIKGQAWIGVAFKTPTFVKCIQTLGYNGNPSQSLGQGTWQGKWWRGGLDVQTSDDGKVWTSVKVEPCVSCNKNIAIVVDGE